MGFFVKMLAFAAALGFVATNPEHIERHYDEIKAETQVLINKMDMYYITMMLEYTYLRKGRYPADYDFPDWMVENFKENPLRELVVDSWGTPFGYVTLDERKKYRLMSAGPDALRGTDDDIIVPRTNRQPSSGKD